MRFSLLSVPARGVRAAGASRRGRRSAAATSRPVGGVAAGPVVVDSCHIDQVPGVWAVCRQPEGGRDYRAGGFAEPVAMRVRRVTLYPDAQGLFGACQLHDNGAITPAISALSAVESLKVAASDAAYATNCFVAESLTVFLAPGAVCLVVTRVCCRLPWLAGRGGGRAAACCRFPKARARQTGVHTGLRTDSVSGTGEKTPGRRCKSPDSRVVSHIAVHRRHENSTG
jgi:hypothetical protein